MNFKQFYLTEATAQYNYIKLFVDKIEKVMLDFSKNPSRYKKYEMVDGYKIPLSDIIKSGKFEKGGFLDNLSRGTLLLAFGTLDFSKTPTITYTALEKDGTRIKRDAYGLFMKSTNLIAIPFINEKNKVPYIDKLDKITSTLFHELTHAVQHVRGDKLKRTGGLEASKWFANKKEQEAVLNQIYKEIQKIITTKFKHLKMYRLEFNKTKDKDFIKEYVDLNNELVYLFTDVERFEKWFDSVRWMIRYQHQKLDEMIDYLKKIHDDVWDDFILDSYVQLKKEFENVIPTAKLKYGDNK